MKKIIAILVCLIMVLTVLVACSKSNDENTLSSTTTTQTQIESQTNEITNATEGADTYSNYVVLSFNAVQGAVIYDQSYDSNGYLESCLYHCKCDACGYVSNNNGQARGNLTSSYHCTQCGNNQKVEITVDQEWVEVPYGY